MQAVLAEVLSELPHLTRIGTVSTVSEALTQIAKLQPDLALIDISLPDGNGLSLIRQLRTSAPDVRALVVSGHESELYTDAALEAGAWGYVAKSRMGTTLIAAIDQVLAGERFFESDPTSSNSTGTPS